MYLGNYYLHNNGGGGGGGRTLPMSRYHVNQAHVPQEVPVQALRERHQSIIHAWSTGSRFLHLLPG